MANISICLFLYTIINTLFFAVTLIWTKPQGFSGLWPFATKANYTSASTVILFIFSTIKG